MNRLFRAVAYATGAAAATSNETESAIFATWAASMTVYGPYPPAPKLPSHITRSPILRLSTPGPTSSSTPAPSTPKTCGRGVAAGESTPRRISRSMLFTPAVRFWTNTCPAPTKTNNGNYGRSGTCRPAGLRLRFSLSEEVVRWMMIWQIDFDEQGHQHH